MFFCLTVLTMALRLSQAYSADFQEVSRINGFMLDTLCPKPLSVRQSAGAGLDLMGIQKGLKQRCMAHINPSSNSSYCMLLFILVSGDVHPHPGPALGHGQFPCGFCEIKCTWDVSNGGGAVCCDDCSMWYHRDCLEMSSATYERLGDNSQSWRCVRCSSHTVKSFTFHEYNVPTSNTFSILQDTTCDSVFQSGNTSQVLSPTGDFLPANASSPRSSSKSSLPRSSTKSSRSSKSDTSSRLLQGPGSKVRILTINANSAKGKPAEIAEIIDYTKPTVTCMTETKLDKSVYSSEFMPKNYPNPLRNDRNLDGGGVLNAHVEGTVVTPVHIKGLKKDCEVIVSRVSTASGEPPLYVMTYYRSQIDNPHNTSLDSLDKAITEVVNLIGNSKGTLILTGDFNCPGIDWLASPPTPGSTYVGICEKLIQITSANGLKQIQVEPTMGDAVLDLVFTNNESLINSVTVIPGVSTANEHGAVVTDLNLRAERTKSAPHKVHLWKSVDWDNIKNKTRTFAQKFLVDHQNSTAEAQNSAIQEHIEDIIAKDIPTKFSKPRCDQPWIDKELKLKCRKKQRLYHKWQKTKGNKKEAREAYKKFHHQVSIDLRKARNKYVAGILAEGLERKSQKPFWRYIKSQRTESTGVAPLKDKGIIYSDPSKKSKILANQFSSVFTNDDTDTNSNITLQGPSIPSMPDITFSVAGVESLLKGVDPKKASGPDAVPCTLLHNLHHELAPCYTLLFQTSYDTGVVPDIWRTAWVSPVFKKGDKCCAVNYRPVSLTCVPCKLMEHIIVSNMRTHFDNHGILTPFQHGFRKNHSCESQLLVTAHDLQKRLDRKEEVDISVLDFSKAFDVVPHKRLVSKLRLYGVHGKNSAWVESFLTGRTQSVMVEGVRSHSGTATAGDDVLSGVPQGTVLGPLLFLVYINDLPSVLDPNTTCRLFADDCLIYRSIRRQEDKLVMQKDLESLHDWGIQWGLKFNVSKCNMMHFSRSQEKPCRFYTLGGEVMSSTSEAQYLGVTLSTRYGTRSSPWKAHIDSIAGKAQQKLGFLRRSLRGCPYSLRVAGYSSLVRSSLEYAGAVWDSTVGTEVDKLEMIQHRAARWSCGIGWREQVSVTQLLEDLRWRPLADRRRVNRLVIFYKVLKQDIKGHIAIDPNELDLSLHRPNTYNKHQYNLKRLSGKDKHSPLWQGTVARTIVEWNSLSPEVFKACEASAAPFTNFKAQLASRP